MKKSVITLLAVAALGAAVPTATVFANNNTAIKAVNPKVEAKIAQLGKEASRLQALRNLALERQVNASQNLINFQHAFEQASAELAAAQAAYDLAVKQAEEKIAARTADYNNDLAVVRSKSWGPGENGESPEATDGTVDTNTKGLTDQYNFDMVGLEAALAEAKANTGAVEAAKANVETEKHNVEEAKKALDDATAELNAVQAEYEKALAAVNALDANAAATIKAGEKTAAPAEMKKEAAKPASKSVAAAATKTAAKALPKTSAVK